MKLKNPQSLFKNSEDITTNSNNEEKRSFCGELQTIKIHPLLPLTDTNKTLATLMGEY